MADRPTLHEPDHPTQKPLFPMISHKFEG